MPPATRLEPDVRRGEILAIARRAFARNGYAPVSMAALAEQAGVTPGLVNHYYGTKRQLYLTVLREAAGRLPLTVRTDLDDLSVEEMIDLNMHGFLDSVDRDREAWALLFGAQGPRDPEIAAIVASVRGEIVERMARNHAGGDPSDELRVALRVFQGAAEAGAQEWLRRGSVRRREQVHAILSRILLAIVTRVVPSTPRPAR